MIASTDLTKTQARQLVASCFHDLVRATEAVGGFMPETTEPHIEIDEQRHLASARIAELRDQCVTRRYAGDVKEAARRLTARLLGFPALLHFASVSGVPEKPPFGAAAGAVAAVSLAGPLVTLALLAWGSLRLNKPWARALVVATGLRFALNFIFLIQFGFVLAGIAAPSDAIFDEVTAALAIGVPPFVLVAIGPIALVAALVRLWRTSSFSEIAVLTIGTAAGAALWMGLLGPLLLP